MSIDLHPIDSKLIRGSVSKNLIGDIARQVGGVNIINSDPNSRILTYLGTENTNEKLIINKEGNFNASKKKVYEGKMPWIDGHDVHAPLLKVDPQLEIKKYDSAESNRPFDILSLGKLHQKIKTTVSRYLDYKDVPALDHKLESNLETDVASEIPKIMGIVNVLADIDLPIARQCESNLQTIVDLSTKYLAPNANTSPNLEHQTKATRVLKSDRAIRIFNAITVDNSTRLATNLEIETIQLSTEVNHFLLVQDLEKYLKTEWKDTSIHQIRESIITQVLPELSKDKYQDPEKLTQAIQTLLLPQIRPIINYITDNFPHSQHAYMLGSNMIEKKANCAGKSAMISLLLQDVGLDARNASCIISRYKKSFGHVYNHIYLPNHAMIEVDGNQSSEFDEANNLFHCNLAIMIERNPARKLPLTQYPSWLEIDSMHDKTYVLDNNQLSTYYRMWGSETHKISSDENGKLPLIDPHNLNIDIESMTSLSRQQKLRYSASLLHLANQASTNHPGTNHNIGISLQNYVEQGVTLSTETKIFYLRQAELLFRKSIEEAPYRPRTRQDLIVNLDNQLRLTHDKETKKNLLIELVKNCQQVLSLKKILPKSMDTPHSTYAIAALMVKTLFSPEYRSLVLNNSVTDIRNTLKESILILESSRPIDIEEKKHLENNLTILRSELKKT